MRHLLVLVFALVAQTALPAQAPVAGPALIVSAEADPNSGTLTIAGSGFGTRPFVTLDLVPLNVNLALDQRIVAVVPVSMIPPGSYLLTVTRGQGAGDSASFDVRIGPAPDNKASAGSGAGLAPSASNPPASPVPPAPGAALPGGSDAAARVGDTTITVADVDREWQTVSIHI
jgi:hypothetical protein